MRGTIEMGFNAVPSTYDKRLECVYVPGDIRAELFKQRIKDIAVGQVSRALQGVGLRIPALLAAAGGKSEDHGKRQKQVNKLFHILPPILWLSNRVPKESMHEVRTPGFAYSTYSFDGLEMRLIIGRWECNGVKEVCKESFKAAAVLVISDLTALVINRVAHLVFLVRTAGQDEVVDILCPLIIGTQAVRSDITSTAAALKLSLSGRAEYNARFAASVS